MPTVAEGANNLYDSSNKQKIVKLTLQDGTPVGAISRVVTHPTLPLSITGHEDRHIRFFDNRTGKQTHSMVAHLDAVTSLAIDGHGLYLISGSKYSNDPNTGHLNTGI